MVSELGSIQLQPRLLSRVDVLRLVKASSVMLWQYVGHRKLLVNAVMAGNSF